MRQGRSNRVECPGQVDRHVAVPIVGRELRGLVPGAYGTGRLHQNIEPSELGRGAVDCGADTRGVREIGLERQRAPTERANLRRRRLGLGVPTAIDEPPSGTPGRKPEAPATPYPPA